MTERARSASGGRATGSVPLGAGSASLYQNAASAYPQIPAQEFQRAVQYISPDGKIASAAEASFFALSYGRGRVFGWACTTIVPGFTFVAEETYNFIAGAARRSTALPERCGGESRCRRGLSWCRSFSCGCLLSSILRRLSRSPFRRRG